MPCLWPNVQGKPSRTRRPEQRQTFNEAGNLSAAENRRLVRVGLTDLLGGCSVVVSATTMRRRRSLTSRSLS